MLTLTADTHAQKMSPPPRQGLYRWCYFYIRVGQRQKLNQRSSETGCTSYMLWKNNRKGSSENKVKQVCTSPLNPPCTHRQKAAYKHTHTRFCYIVRNGLHMCKHRHFERMAAKHMWSTRFSPQKDKQQLLLAESHKRLQRSSVKEQYATALLISC